MPCLAQETDDLELNLFVGGTAYTKNKFDIPFPQSATPIPTTVGFDNSIRGGIRLNVFNGGHWGEEFFYSYEPNQATIQRGTSASPTKLDIQVHNFGINALFYPSPDEERKVRPFVSFGLGGTIYRPTQEARQAAADPNRANLPGFGLSKEFALNYGLGIKSRFNNRFGFRVDARGFLGRNPSFSMPRESNNPSATVLPAGGAIHTLEASAGVIFYLGR
jgi:hypothetical protein